MSDEEKKETPEQKSPEATSTEPVSEVGTATETAPASETVE